jgi:hypothetical protein
MLEMLEMLLQVKSLADQGVLWELARVQELHLGLRKQGYGGCVHRLQGQLPPCWFEQSPSLCLAEVAPRGQLLSRVQLP